MSHIPYPDSEGLWECKDGFLHSSCTFRAIKEQGELVLVSEKTGIRLTRRCVDQHISFVKVSRTITQTSLTADQNTLTRYVQTGTDTKL